MIRIRLWRAVVVLLTLAGVQVAIGARFAPAEIKNVPVERVTANLEREIKERPKDVDLLVNLARIHAMAYAKKTTTVPMPSEQGGPWLGQGVPPYKQFPVESTEDVKRQAVAREHLRTAIARYREALILEPANDVAALGLGWALIEIGDTGAAVPVLRDLIARSWPLDQAANSSTDRPRPTPMYGQPFLTDGSRRSRSRSPTD